MFVKEKPHALRTTFKRNDENIRSLFSAADIMRLIGLDKYDFSLSEQTARRIFYDGNFLLIHVNNFPKIVHFLRGRISPFQFLIVDRHDFLYVQEICDFVHIKMFCRFPPFHDLILLPLAFIIPYLVFVCKIFHGNILRNIL